MIHLGKWAEVDDEKLKAVWMFIYEHLNHKLRMTGDEYASDGEMIVQGENGWVTDFKLQSRIDMKDKLEEELEWMKKYKLKRVRK
jgi:hypothetical protein